MALGAPWIKWDDMTESLRALYVEVGLTEIFSEVWRTHETWTKSSDTGPRQALTVKKTPDGSVTQAPLLLLLLILLPLFS